MYSSQQILKAGDVNIDMVEITSTNGLYQDITNQIMAIQIFEDLFSPFITGTLEVKDSLDLLNLFPFTGEEFLHLKISTPTLQKGNIDGKFYVYKMSNRVPSGDKSFVYTLSFISREAIIDLNKKISKSFGGKCSDIAKTLLTDTANGLQITRNVVIEETGNRTKFISNFWSPVKNINTLLETSVNKNGSSSYVFYEDRYGFNFVSLESLYNQEKTFQEFIYDHYVRDMLPDGKSVRNVNEDYKRIRDINIPTAYDYIERTRSGMNGSRLFTYDILTKRFNNKSYDASEVFQNQIHLNKYPLFSKKNISKVNSTIMAMTKDSESFSGFGDVTNAGNIQNRVSLISQLNASKLEIIVPGRMDYTVGQRINLKIFKSHPTSDTDTDILDQLTSGAYLISAINHYINRNMHECTIEIVKESLIRDLDKVK